MYVKDHDQVRRRRLERGFTQKQLAALVGTTQQYVSLIESGRSGDCSDRVVFQLCRWLDVDAEDYFEVSNPRLRSNAG